MNPDFLAFLKFTFVMIAHLYTVESLAILIASLIPNFVISIIMLNSIISQLFVFNGYFLTVGNMMDPMKAFYYVSPFAYTTQALFKIVFADDLTIKEYSSCVSAQNNQSDNGPCFGATGAAVLDSLSTGDMEYRDVEPFTNVAIVISFAIFLRFLSWALLRRFVY